MRRERTNQEKSLMEGEGKQGHRSERQKSEGQAKGKVGGGNKIE